MSTKDKIVLAVVVGLCIVAAVNLTSKMTKEVDESRLQSQIAIAEMAYTAAQVGVPLSEVTNRVTKIYRKNH